MPWPRPLAALLAVRGGFLHAARTPSAPDGHGSTYTHRPRATQAKARGRISAGARIDPTLAAVWRIAAGPCHPGFRQQRHQMSWPSLFSTTTYTPPTPAFSSCFTLDTSGLVAHRPTAALSASLPLTALRPSWSGCCAFVYTALRPPRLHRSSALPSCSSSVILLLLPVLPILHAYHPLPPPSVPPSLVHENVILALSSTHNWTVGSILGLGNRSSP